jgi:hypothetical protein
MTVKVLKNARNVRFETRFFDSEKKSVRNLFVYTVNTRIRFFACET